MTFPNQKSIADILRALAEKAPLGTAEEWDNVGLLVGDPQQKTKGAVVSVDLTFESIELAIQRGYSLIVNHHPCIFPKQRGISKIVAGTPIFEAIRKGIAVAAYHSNFDQCALEVVQSISNGLGIQAKGRLIEKAHHSLMKLVTFVPMNDLEKVRTALIEAGAGHVGNYDSCTFSSQGEGTFRGGVDTHPTIGSAGQFEKVAEARLETVFPRGLQNLVVQALKKAHPYEEVAYDLYSVEQSASQQGIVKGMGYGFWGEFPMSKPFSDFANDVKRLFNIHGFWITSPTPSTVKRVGFAAGKGASFVDAASSVQCDVFVTGEAGYHAALGGSRRGMAVMELGHRESERFFIKTMKDWLSCLGLEIEECETPTQIICSGGTK